MNVLEVLKVKQLVREHGMLEIIETILREDICSAEDIRTLTDIACETVAEERG